MSVLVGTMMLGKVESLDGESIRTKFFVLGIPLVPIESVYVVSGGWGEYRGYRIPLRGSSVLAGYLRIPCWVFGSAVSIVAVSGWWRGTMEDLSGARVAAVVLMGTALIATFLIGGLSRGERFRRGILKRRTGTGARPWFLPLDMRTRITKALLASWNAAHPREPWEEAVRDGKADELLYCLALYQSYPKEAEAIVTALERKAPAA